MLRGNQIPQAIGLLRRNRLICGICIVLVAGCLCAARPLAASASPPWQKVWYYNFNGPAGAGLPATAWTYDTGQGIFGTGEVEDMTSSPSNVHVDGAGDLDITALGHGSSWTSGRVSTTRLFTAPAGGELEVTASIRQPSPSHGLGYWPAFWMLGQGSWPAHGEIDILEDVNAVSEHSGTLHCGNLVTRNADGTFGPCHEYNGLGSHLQPCPDCQSGYQTYSVVIDRENPAAEKIFWFLDGRQFFTVSEQQVGAAAWDEAVDGDFRVILDLAIGGNYPDGQCGCTTPTSATSSGGTMSVRYVGVYER
jgi:beta-glucanase (GH16 family)